MDQLALTPGVEIVAAFTVLICIPLPEVTDV
jgi:hypothetical protein